MACLLFVGDPHGEFAPIFDRAMALGPEAIVLLGDQTPAMDGLLALLDEVAPVYYILGNHDTDPVQRDTGPSPWYPYLERHLEELPPDRDLTGRVVELGGLRIAGLGGVFRSKIWSPPGSPLYPTRAECTRDTPRHTRYRAGPPAKQWSSIWAEDYNYLAKRRADILVTHDAPESHRHGWQILGDLGRSMRVAGMVHGHHHDGYYAEIAGSVRVVGTEIPAEERLGMGMVTEDTILG